MVNERKEELFLNRERIKYLRKVKDARENRDLNELNRCIEVLRELKKGALKTK